VACTRGVVEELERSQGAMYRFTYVKQDHFTQQRRHSGVHRRCDPVAQRLTHEQQHYVRRFSIPVRMCQQSARAEWALNEMAKGKPEPLRTSFNKRGVHDQ